MSAKMKPECINSMFYSKYLLESGISVVKGVPGARQGAQARRGARKVPQRHRGEVPLVRCLPLEPRRSPRCILLGERRAPEADLCF